MSVTQTIAIQKILVKHKFTEKESTEIIDYVDKQKGDYATKEQVNTISEQVNTVKVSVFLLAGFMAILASIMIYLHGDTRQGMSKLESRIDNIRTELKADIKELRNDNKTNTKIITKKIEQPYILYKGANRK